VWLTPHPRDSIQREGERERETVHDKLCEYTDEFLDGRHVPFEERGYFYQAPYLGYIQFIWILWFPEASIFTCIVLGWLLS